MPTWSAGYPNGDAELARLCLVFCSDAFEEGRDEDLFYVNDMKVRIGILHEGTSST